MVGFSRMRDEDQLTAIQQVIEWIRQSLANHGLDQENYRWSPAGDGGYLTFDSSAACRAAIDIAITLCRKTRETTWRTTTGDAIQLKFAVHAGTVVESSELGRESNIWGEGINTAERILGICAPSQILISQPYFDLYVKSRGDKIFNVGDVHWRTVKHGLQVAVMNVNRHDVGLNTEESGATQWRAIGSLWQRTIQEYQFLIHDALKSAESVPALAAAKFLLNLGDQETAYKVCCMIGQSEDRPWANYQVKQNPLFARMPADLLMKVIAESTPRLFQKGDILCEEGDLAGSCFFPVSGTIAVEATGVNKRISFGEIIGEFSLWIPNIRRTARLRALDDSLLLEVSNSRFNAVLEKAPPAVGNDIYKIIKSRIMENVFKSTILFPGLADSLKKSMSSVPLSCEKHAAGSCLDLSTSAYVLFNGKVCIDSSEGIELVIEAHGRIGGEQVIGIICDFAPTDGKEAKVIEDSVVVELPHAVLRQWQKKFPAIRDAWNRLGGARLGQMQQQMKREDDTQSDDTDSYLIVKTVMENKLRSLKARALALNTRLEDLKDRRDRGRLDEGRYVDLTVDLDNERNKILFELQDILAGKDQDLDEILNDATNGVPDEELRGKLVKVAAKKNLGDTFVAKLNEHKGTIVSWLVEIGSALASRIP